MRMEKVHTHTLGQVKFEGVLIGKVTFFTTQSILDGNFKFTWKPYCHFASEMKHVPCFDYFDGNFIKEFWEDCSKYAEKKFRQTTE